MQRIKIDGVEYILTVTLNAHAILVWKAAIVARPEMWWQIDRHGVELPGTSINPPDAFKRACVAWLQSDRYGGMTLKEFLEATND